MIHHLDNVPHFQVLRVHILFTTVLYDDRRSVVNLTVCYMTTPIFVTLSVNVRININVLCYCML